MTSKTLAAAALALALLACRGPDASAGPISSQAGLAQSTVRIDAGGRRHDFRVEVAATAAEQSTGMMFVESMAPDVGMLFPFAPPRPASFWMKDTFVPLDLLFVREDCSIAKVAVNAVPRSLEPIATEESVAAVLEIAGGRSAELGISEGDCASWAGGPQPR